MTRRWQALGLALGVLLALSACGSSSSSGSAVPTAQTVRAQPAGVNPSKSARMVCESEAQKDLAGALGVTPTLVTPPTWVDHVYSCSYVYPDGTLTLSVKELSSAAQTTRYFDQLGKELGRQVNDVGEGQGSFLTKNNSLVVRKEWKVLLVDVTKLPAEFGKPPYPLANIALGVGTIIMGCWTGA